MDFFSPRNNYNSNHFDQPYLTWGGGAEGADSAPLGDFP